MEALEKLKRLTNPKCVADYGLSVSLSELMESDEGSEWVLSFLEDYVPVNRWPKNIIKMANRPLTQTLKVAASQLKYD